MLNRDFAIYGKPYIFNHLPGAHFHCQHGFDLAGNPGDLFLREGEQRDQPDQADLYLSAYSARLARKSADWSGHHHSLDRASSLKVPE